MTGQTTLDEKNGNGSGIGVLPPARWLDRIRKKGRSKTTMVVAVLTDDPKRNAQYRRYMESRILGTQTSRKKDGTSNAVRGVIYDGHKGVLESRVKDGKVVYEPISLEQQHDPMMDGPEGTGDLFNLGQDEEDGQGALEAAVGAEQPVAVQMVSGAIKQGRTIVLIQNIQDGTPQLQEAVRSWCGDYALYKTGSVVAVFDPSPTRILTQESMAVVKVITPPVSTEEERRAILEPLGSKYGLDVEAFIAATRGVNLHNVEGMANEVYLTMQEEGSTSTTLDTSLVHRLKEEQLAASGLVMVLDSKYTMEDGMGQTFPEYQQELRDAMLMGIPDKVVKAHHLKRARGIIVHGPAGTGKTYSIECLGKSCDLPTFLLGAVKDSHVGQTKRNILEVKRICEAAAPCILIIDEIDVLFMSREGSSHKRSVADEELTEEVLKWLSEDDRGTIVCGMTNLPWRIDDALVRDSRIDVKIPLMYPDEVSRYEVLQVQVRLREANLDKNVDLKAIAKATPLLTCDELKGIVNRAKKYSARSGRLTVTQEDLVKAVSIKSTVNPRKIRKKAQKYLAQCQEQYWECDPDLLEATVKMAQSTISAAVAKGADESQDGQDEDDDQGAL